MVLTEEWWGEELDKFKATVSPPWSNGSDGGGMCVCVCACSEWVHVCGLRQSRGKGRE